MLYHVVLSLCGVGGWYSQRLLSLNPTTVMVALLLGLWLLFGCDNYNTSVIKAPIKFTFNELLNQFHLQINFCGSDKIDKIKLPI